ncbi:META domain-containing protein [Thalassospira lohafexi]|nr:META domain-containing protein [Thalassospira lohafexi]
MDGSKTLTPMSPVLATANFTKDSKVVGSTGCNRYFGTYEENDGKLKLSPLGATQMMCVEDAMEIENAFNNAMEKVTDWQLAKDALVLSDTNGKPIMEFVPITP